MASQEVLIEIEPWEERVAVREAGVLSEFALERPADVPRVGSVYRGRVVTLLPSVGAALVDIGEGDSAFLPLRDSESGEQHAPVHRGDVVLVQVTKRPLGGKRAQVTRGISLAGRYAVLMPHAPALKVSRRIEDGEERHRLESVFASIRPPDCGLVARTASLGRPASVIEPDLRALLAEWEGIVKRAATAGVPSCVRVAPPLRVRALRDMCGPGVERVRICGDDGSLLAFVKERYPDLADSIESEPQEGLFWRTGLEAELEQLLERRVFLKSGGSLVFDFTEALTVVDVNSGRPFEEGSPEEIALRTNLEAAQEIPRQLKLRGIGGIIVVDFIDMPSPEHQKQMLEVLEAALKHDRVKTQVAALSPLGVVEMTRKRVEDTPYHHLTESCPTCGGRGRTLAPATLVIQVARKVLRVLREGGHEPLTVRVHPRVARALREDSHLLTAVLRDRGRTALSIVDDPAVPYEQYRVTPAEG